MRKAAPARATSQDTSEQGNFTTPTPDLSEARRLFDGGFQLVSLHTHTKQPVGEEWNKKPITHFDDSATGYGLPLVLNNLASIDPDHAEMARAGLKAWGFDLDELMEQGVRTASTRPNSGGRAAFQADEYGTCRWLPFRVFSADGESITVLELRAQSENLQDTIPGIVYADKATGELCTQYYENGKRLDDAPPLPDKFARLWRMLSIDDEKLREYSKIFSDAIIDAGFEVNGKKPIHKTPMGSGQKLAFPSKCRASYNAVTDINDIFNAHGYEYHARLKRWSRPGASGQPGIRLIPGKDDLFRSDHAGDALFGTFDKWAAHVLLDHDGDVAAAEADEALPPNTLAHIDFAAGREKHHQEAEKAAEELDEKDEADTYQNTFSGRLPGFLGVLQDYIYGAQIYPDMGMAGLAALAFATHFTQTKAVIKTPYGPLSLSEYYVVMAKTTSGKDSLRKALQTLMRSTYLPVGSEVHYSLPASQQGLHKLLEENHAATFLSDEFGEWLAQSTSKNRDSHRQGCVGYLMEIYTSGTGSVCVPNAVTNNYSPVENPRVTILATTTGERLAESMSLSQAESGTYNRMVLYVGAQERIPKRYDGYSLTPSQALVDWLKWLPSLGNDTEICFDYEALNFYKEYDSTVIEKIKFDDPALGGRLSEQAFKMAGLFALSDKRTVINKEDLELAYKIRLSLYEQAKAFLSAHGSLSGEDETVQAFNQIHALLKKKKHLPLSRLPKDSRAYQKLTQFQRDKTLDALKNHGIAKAEKIKGGYSIVFIGDR